MFQVNYYLTSILLHIFLLEIHHCVCLDGDVVGTVYVVVVVGNGEGRTAHCT